MVSAEAVRALKVTLFRKFIAKKFWLRACRPLRLYSCNEAHDVGARGDADGKLFDCRRHALQLQTVRSSAADDATAEV